jgi:ribosomal protein S27AE
MKSAQQGFVRATVEGEHRDGICENCGERMVMENKRLGCGKCGGTKGRLIARSVSIQPPPPPSCTTPSCLWQFFKDSLYSSLLSTYHMRRVVYAEKRRHKKIPIRYRTGSPIPENIKQAIWEIIKLRLRR